MSSSHLSPPSADGWSLGDYDAPAIVVNAIVARAIISGYFGLAD
jgi:hypothetical protein